MVSLPVLGSDTTYTVNPGKIIALGLNYREHVAESLSVLKNVGTTLPKEPASLSEPVLFAKTPNVLIGPGDPIVLPTTFLIRSGFPHPRTDLEGELAIVIGERCRRISPKEARRHVFGYTCFNDVSQRDIQNSDRSGWFRGKSFDSFGPVGPVIVPETLIGDPQHLAVESRLNGKTVQRSDTSHMIFPIPELLSFISWNLTLEPGDLVITGTPSGVRPLAAGDLVEIEIEKIGVLRNPVRED